MSIIKNITESGVSFTSSRLERRNIILSNYIAMIIASAPLFQVFARLLFYELQFWFAVRLLGGTVLFLSHILLNRAGYTIIARLSLCWLPYFYLFASTILSVEEGAIGPSAYIGLRFFFLAVCGFPLMVFSLKEKGLLCIGLLAPFTSLLMFDPLLNFFDVGFFQQYYSDSGYPFNTVRAIVSFFIVDGCFLAMKIIVERGEEKNDRLVAELAEKNLLIKQQAEHEVHQLNQKLLANVQQLQEREFILMQSQRIAKIGSWEYYEGDNSMFWSDEMFNIFGLDRNTPLTATELSQMLWGMTESPLKLANGNLLATGQPYDQIARTRTPLGYVKWIRVYGFPIYRDSVVIGSRGICHDITFYKEAEERTLTSEKKYRALFEQASDAIMVTDFNGNLTDVNASLCRMLGYRREELLRMNIKSLIDPQHLQEKPIQFPMLKIGEHVFSERPMVHKNGMIIEVEANVKKSDDDRVMAIVRDVTLLRRAQKQVQISEALFRGAFEDSAIGMAVVSLGGNWLKVNRALIEITGYSEKEFLAMNFQDITHPDDSELGILNIERARAGEVSVVNIEKRYIHKIGMVIWVNINISVIRDGMGRPLYFVTQVENISDKKIAELEKDKARYLLNERIKELTTLHRTSQILQDESNTIEDVLSRLVVILPPGWQYPEICAARIVLGDQRYKTRNYQVSEFSQRANFLTSYGEEGLIEVVYLEPRPTDAEGPFLAEERNLIDMIAEMLRVYLEKKHDEGELKKAAANLNATINNTEILIWSVDRDFNILTFNRQFYNYILATYGRTIKAGHRIFPDTATNEDVELRNKWEQIYLRALAGEIITLEETRQGIDFRYSLSPIIEEEKVIGVSVFADNITDRKARDRELADANKKIGELKLMALRSVMNPHFIFNVLNSIQFFIAKNDRVNAINYLSTFSKLIRGILTHSVNNKIKLVDEIEMLKNYVQLEMTRFENKFNFVLNVDREIETDSIEIPSLLVQPYVENAILHGLYNKEGQGTLTINVLDKPNAIVFEIQDDGIGREAAIRLREQNFPAHKSIGINITEERLRLINQRQNVAFEVQDLADDSGPCGTKVTIWVTV